MHGAYVLYGVTASGCVAKVCSSDHESDWTVVSPDVYCALRWLDVDSSMHAYAQLKRAAAALELAKARVPRPSALYAELSALSARTLALRVSPALHWCAALTERVRTGPRTPLERLALSVAGLE